MNLVIGDEASPRPYRYPANRRIDHAHAATPQRRYQKHPVFIVAAGRRCAPTNLLLRYEISERHLEPIRIIHHHLTTDEPRRWMQDDSRGDAGGITSFGQGARRCLAPTRFHDGGHGAGDTNCRRTAGR